MENENKIRSTTVIAVRRNGKVAMAGDGQVTMGNTVMKGNAKKVRRIYDGKVLTGFAGAFSTALEPNTSSREIVLESSVKLKLSTTRSSKT